MKVIDILNERDAKLDNINREYDAILKKLEEKITEKDLINNGWNEELFVEWMASVMYRKNGKSIFYNTKFKKVSTNKDIGNNRVIVNFKDLENYAQTGQ